MGLPEPGERFVASNGKHAGNEVEVIKTTGADRVVVRRVGKEGVAWNKAKSEAAGVQTLGRSLFEASYVPKGSESAPAAGTGTAYRRRYTRRQNPDQIGLPESKVIHLAEARDRVSASGLHIEVMVITPDQARAWLDRGGPNRKVSERRVERYAAAMLKGEWMLTGEGILLDADSRVRNGQHRLEAIIRAGIPISSVVVRNVTEKAFDVMDTGGTRTAADVLGIHGHAQRFALASAARTLIIIERFGRVYVSSFRDPNTAPSIPEQVAYVDAHPEVREGVLLATRIHNAGFIGGTGLWATAMTLLFRTDPQAAAIFVEHLVEGDNLPRGSAILRLRNTFMSQYTAWDNSARGRELLVALVIKAWNFWRRQETIQNLVWRSDGRGAEAFPVPE